MLMNRTSMWLKLWGTWTLIFKEFVKVSLRKRPQARHIGAQSEKLEKNAYVVTKTSRVGEGTVSEPIAGGFKNILGRQICSMLTVVSKRKIQMIWMI